MSNITRKEKLKTLEKRYRFLVKRISESKIDLTWDKAEASSLRFALTELSEKYNYDFKIDDEDKK